MTFEDMEKVWQTGGPDPQQSTENADVGHKVQQHLRSTELEASMFEFGLSTVFAMTGLIALADAVIDREPLYSYLTASISLGVSAYVYLGRVNRLSRQAGFDQTMIGFLERGISNIDYQISRVRNFFWWFILPSIVASGISMAYTFQGRPLWVWIIQPLGILAMFVAMRFALRTTYLPKRRSLETLRADFLAQIS